MITPKYLKNNDTIGYSSMSNGITKEKKIVDLENSKKLLKNYNVISDKYVNCSVKGESFTAFNRFIELKKMIEDKNINTIFSITGGSFLNEVLNYIDNINIMDNIKWFQGQSDSTLLLYYLTTKYDLKTIYSFNANSLSKTSSKEVNDNISIICGKKFNKLIIIINGILKMILTKKELSLVDVLNV